MSEYSTEIIYIRNFIDFYDKKVKKRERE